jgi:hypothetical protein
MRCFRPWRGSISCRVQDHAVSPPQVVLYLASVQLPIESISD